MKTLKVTRVVATLAVLRSTRRDSTSTYSTNALRHEHLD